MSGTRGLFQQTGGAQAMCTFIKHPPQAGAVWPPCSGQAALSASVRSLWQAEDAQAELLPKRKESRKKSWGFVVAFGFVLLILSCLK